MLECIVVFLGVLLDQLSKLWVVDAMYQSSMAVWPGVFGFTYVENTGAAFGVLGKSTLVLTVVSALAMVVLCFVLVKFRKELSKFGRVGLALIIAGGLGNLIDRVFLGYVVDFINLEFMQFAVFNVADICATVGTVCLLIAIIFGERKKGKRGVVRRWRTRWANIRRRRPRRRSGGCGWESRGYARRSA